MTEDEAKTKWCPFGIKRGGSTRDGYNEPETTCVASECMAWRWISEDYKGTGGYCGLAGKP